MAASARLPTARPPALPTGPPEHRASHNGPRAPISRNSQPSASLARRCLYPACVRASRRGGHISNPAQPQKRAGSRDIRNVGSSQPFPRCCTELRSLGEAIGPVSEKGVSNMRNIVELLDATADLLKAIVRIMRVLGLD